MDIEYFIQKVDKQEFQKASNRALYKAKNWEVESQNTNLDDVAIQSDYELITGLIEFLFNSKIEKKKRIDLLFDLYRLCPSFTVIDDLYVNYWNKLFELEKNLFWKHVINILNSEKKYLKEPIIYALWCDFFEGPETVTESWNALITKEATDEVLKTVLINAGPVPFYLKKELYYRLIGSKYWHKYIFKSLLHSEFDYYGDIDKEEALKIINKLNVPKNTEHKNLLLEKLTSE